MAGHALPAIALARALDEGGHDVLVLTADEWSDLLSGLGLRQAGEQEMSASRESAVGPEVEAVAQRARTLLPTLREFAPDVVVSDGFSVAPALAAELAGAPRATLFPQVYPIPERGLPPFPSGLLPARTPLGRAAWALGRPLLERRTRWPRRQYDAVRELLGLAPVEGVAGWLSDRLVLVATLPQLEYPRRWPAHVHATGPMMVEARRPALELPPGDEPLVVVAASTVKDLERRLVGVALEALADERVRVLVTMGGTGQGPVSPLPGNARVVDWISYEQVMPLASAVVCHGNHGTVTAALAHGAPVLVSPVLADDADHGARVTWAGCGLMVPRWALRPGPMRLAVRRLLDEPRFATRAQRIAAWSRANDGAARGAELVEQLAGETA